MRRRLLITGGHGFVAGSVIFQAGEAWEVHALSRGAPLLDRKALHWHVLDIGDADALRRVFEETAPDAVIHTAALSNIDYCEAHPEEAERVNARITCHLAELCRNLGVKLVHCSTDNVFNGDRGMYREEDPPSPINVYAVTKVRAEEAAASAPGAVVARLSVVMGLPLLRSGNAFLSRMITQLEAGAEVGVPENEIRTPIDVITVGRALLELAAAGISGFIHLAGNDRINRFAMVQYIAGQLGYSPALIVPNDPTRIPGRAPRPLDVSLDNAKARRILKTPMLGLAEGVELIKATRRKS